MSKRSRIAFIFIVFLATLNIAVLAFDSVVATRQARTSADSIFTLQQELKTALQRLNNRPSFDFNNDQEMDALLYTNRNTLREEYSAKPLICSVTACYSTRTAEAPDTDVEAPIFMIKELSEGYLFADKVDNYWIYTFGDLPEAGELHVTAKLVRSGNMRFERDKPTY